MERIRSDRLIELFRKSDEAQRRYTQQLKDANSRRRPEDQLALGTPYYVPGDQFIRIDRGSTYLACDFEGNYWNRGTWIIPDPAKPKERVWEAGFLCDITGARITSLIEINPPEGVKLPEPNKRRPSY